MLLFPSHIITSLGLTSHFKNVRGRFSGRAERVIRVEQKDIEEVLRESIDACYRSGGQEVSRNLVQWMKKGVKIPYTGLPRDIQDGVTGILLKSIRYKEMIRKIITGIPS